MGGGRRRSHPAGGGRTGRTPAARPDCDRPSPTSCRSGDRPSAPSNTQPIPTPVRRGAGQLVSGLAPASGRGMAAGRPAPAGGPAGPASRGSAPDPGLPRTLRARTGGSRLAGPGRAAQPGADDHGRPLARLREPAPALGLRRQRGAGQRRADGPDAALGSAGPAGCSAGQQHRPSRIRMHRPSRIRSCRCVPIRPAHPTAANPAAHHPGAPAAPEPHR